MIAPLASFKIERYLVEFEGVRVITVVRLRNVNDHRAPPFDVTLAHERPDLLDAWRTQKPVHLVATLSEQS